MFCNLALPSASLPIFAFHSWLLCVSLLALPDVRFPPGRPPVWHFTPGAPPSLRFPPDRPPALRFPPGCPPSLPFLLAVLELYFCCSCPTPAALLVSPGAPSDPLSILPPGLSLHVRLTARSVSVKFFTLLPLSPAMGTSGLFTSRV